MVDKDIASTDKIFIQAMFIVSLISVAIALAFGVFFYKQKLEGKEQELKSKERLIESKERLIESKERLIESKEQSFKQELKSKEQLIESKENKIFEIETEKQILLNQIKLLREQLALPSNEIEEKKNLQKKLDEAMLKIKILEQREYLYKKQMQRIPEEIKVHLNKIPSTFFLKKDEKFTLNLVLESPPAQKISLSKVLWETSLPSQIKMLRAEVLGNELLLNQG
jgi:chromosome segregation ATPase